MFTVVFCVPGKANKNLKKRKKAEKKQPSIIRREVQAKLRRMQNDWLSNKGGLSNIPKLSPMDEGHEQPDPPELSVRLRLKTTRLRSSVLDMSDLFTRKVH